VLGLGCHLILGQLRHVFVAPNATVLRIIDDLATVLTVVDNNVDDVGACDTFSDAFNSVASEFAL